MFATTLKLMAVESAVRGRVGVGVQVVLQSSIARAWRGVVMDMARGGDGHVAVRVSMSNPLDLLTRTGQVKCAGELAHWQIRRPDRALQRGVYD